jgi:predicted nuclease of predicted toxin-antitoxin system
MSLRFFADQCISNYIIDTLQAAGHKVFRLKEHISPDSPDSIVIQKAKELDSILISLNGDFADIVMYPPSEYKGIFALQVRNHPEIIPQLMQRLLNYLTVSTDMDYYSGKLFLVEVHRIRIKQ